MTRLTWLPVLLLAGCLTVEGAELVTEAERSVVRVWMSSEAPAQQPVAACPKHCVYTYVCNGGHACCAYCARSCTGCWTKADESEACEP